MKSDLIILAAILALCRCCTSPEPVTPAGPESPEVLRVRAEDYVVTDLTRSSVSDAGVFSWTEGDAVSLFTDSGRREFKLKTATAAGIAEFDGDLDGLTSASAAICPASAAVGPDSVILPFEYVWQSGSPTVLLAAAPVDPGQVVTMKHIGGLVRIRIKDIPDGADALVVTADKRISGNFSIKDGIISADSGQGSVTVRFTPGTHPDHFDIPVPAGTFKMDIKLMENGQPVPGFDFPAGEAIDISRRTLVLMNLAAEEKDPDADLFDIEFLPSGSARNVVSTGPQVKTVPGSSLTVEFNEKFQRYTARFSPSSTAGTVSSGFYIADYSQNEAFMKALENGCSFEVVFKAGVKHNKDKEVKMFSMTQSGGAGFTFGKSSTKNCVLCFQNQTDGDWRSAATTTVPEIYRYYHAVGVYDKEHARTSIYLDGDLAGFADAPGTFTHAAENARYIGIGGDAKASASQLEAGFNGEVVIARIYSRVLSESEIRRRAASFSDVSDLPSPATISHPVLFFPSSDYSELVKTIGSGSNPYLANMHKSIMMMADNYVAAGINFDYGLDASGTRLQNCPNTDAYLVSLAYAYRYSKEEKYLNLAKQLMQKVEGLSDWHAKEHFLDAAEIGCGMGFAYDWLYGALTDEERSAARDNIVRNILTPALDGSWNWSLRTNWNQVCNAGIAICALAVMDTDRSLTEKILRELIPSNSMAVDYMYAPDGNYPEGYSYWEYGTSFQVLIEAALYSVFGNDGGIHNGTGFDKTAQYMLYMVGPSGLNFNYSDGAPWAGALPPLWYFAWQFDDPSLLYQETRYAASSGYMAGNYANRFIPAWMYFVNQVKPEAVSAPSKPIWSGGGITPVVLIHSDWTGSATDKFLGIKAGTPTASHAHMDGGSFVYDAFGQRWSADLGYQAYAPLEAGLAAQGGNLWSMTQNSMRWSIVRYNNYNHSTVTINDALHLVSGNVTISEVIEKQGELGATVDMTSLFSGVRSMKRTARIVDNRDLVVTDRLVPSGAPVKFRWNMITTAVPTVGTDGIVLTQGGKTMLLKAVSSTGAAVSYRTWSLEVTTSYEESMPGYYNVGFEIADAAEMDIVTTLSPVN